MQPTYTIKNKVKGLLSVVIICLVLFSLSPSSQAQSLGENMSNPIIMGTYGGGTFSYTDTKNNGSYSNDYGQASGDIFYTFTVQGSTQITISHCASAFDTYMYLLNASGVVVALNDDNGPACSGLTASIGTTLAAGTYYIVAEGYYTNTGNITTAVSLTVQAPPVAGDTRNFIKVWEATSPETDANTLLTKSLSDVKHSVTYFDGLGRPVQSIVKNGSLSVSGNFDLVSPVEYDSFGREVKKYLPYTSPSSDGLYKSNMLAEQNNFYTGTSSPITGQGETFFFSKTNYESSPLNRVEKTMAPGNSWVGSDLGVQVKYYVNTTTDAVRIWNVTNNTTQGQFGTYSSTEAYSAGELYKNITVDEQGKQVIEFKDKEGKVILKKVQISSTAGTGDDGTGRGYIGWLSTYYVYDDLGNLRCVIQPEGVKAILSSWSLTTALLNEQCFRYEYDQRNRMIMKKVPGAGEVYMVYDYRDRLVMTQDANLRTINKWMVTLYDALNRPEQTGLLTNTWNNKTFTQHLNDAAISITDYPFSSTAALSVSFWEYLSKTGYDNYISIPGNSGLDQTLDLSYNSLLNGNPGSPVYAVAMPASASNQTKGMVTWTETKILGTSAYIYTVALYDEKGRTIQQKSKNILGGIDIITTEYSWAGQPLTVVQKQAGNAQTHTVITRMQYDDLGRVLNVKKAVNSVVNGIAVTKPEQLIVQNEYDATGQLKKKILGANNLETLNYDYNIRGWLLGMNRNYLASTGQSGKTKFGFELGYDKLTNSNGRNFNMAQFNGNISGMVWKTDGDDVKRKYDYNYDAVNRLMKGLFEQDDASNAWNSTTMNYSMQMGDGGDAATAYDANGNIKAMTQYGWKLGGTGAPIDNLRYTYETGTNRLKSVTDFNNEATSTLGDFKTNVSHVQNSIKAALTTNSTQSQFDEITDYTYDLNGNLNLDNNKGVSSITYNHLNLPSVITVSGKGNITYTYDAFGNKLKKQANEPGATVPLNNINYTSDITTTTYYLAGLVYESKSYSNPTVNTALGKSDILQFIPQEEGRIRFIASDNTASPAIVASFQYDYMLKDHLGNVRMVLTEEVKADQYPAATMETANTASENLLYTNIDNTRTGKPGWFNDPVYGSGSQVAKVKNEVGSQKTGPGILLKVMAGDSYNIRVVSGWTGTNPTQGPGNNVLSELLNTLTNGIPGQSGGKATVTQLQNLSSGLNNALTSFLATQPAPAGKPKAYINWVLFDEQFKIDPVNSNFQQVGASGTSTEHVLNNLPVNKSGYLYIYVSNESDNLDVFFDNLQVTHNRGPILEETHYYPFGLTMSGISSKAAGGIENRKKYNGIEFDEDLDLDTYEAYYRNLDPQIARWWQIDPKVDEGMESVSPYASMYDDPIKYSDPLGDEPDGDDPGVGSVSWNFVKGVGQSLWGTVEGVGTAIAHPIQTAEGLGHAVAHPIETANAIGNAVSETYSDFKNGNGDVKANILGKVVGEIGQALVGTSEVKAGVNAIRATRLEGTLVKVATEAKEITGAGKGAAYGTKVHSEFKGILDSKGIKNVSTEVSYKNGKVVPYGTKGSVRADVVVGNPSKPKAIYDLKTGSAELSKKQISRYQQHAPSAKTIKPIRPE